MINIIHVQCMFKLLCSCSQINLNYVNQAHQCQVNPSVFCGFESGVHFCVSCLVVKCYKLSNRSNKDNTVPSYGKEVVVTSVTTVL